MIISKNWLAQYLDVKDYSIEELADKITGAGQEVEGIIKLSQGDNLVVGEIIECEEHPDSDHLHVCKVNIGDKVETIVCGAPNARKGIKVIVALVGAKLPGGNINAGVIRGVESNGMMCSLLELGVDEHSLTDKQKEGIEELSDDALVGDHDPLAFLGLDDVLLDIGLTPNRNDCMAAWSMAKEVGAVLHQSAKLPECKDASNIGTQTNLIVNSETDKCPLFYGKVVNHVEIKPSPRWMKQLLNAVGMKSINNVVDISNLVMLETGQPLHFYDASKLEKQELIVKQNLTTTYTALDGIEYTITPDELMITTNNKPIGIAGIMGGNDSKIDETTTSIIIEAALFNHVSIRNSARRLNLNTDACIRFQKGIDPLAPIKAMDRAVSLLIEYANATDFEETAKYDTTNYEPTHINVKLDNINKLLGTNFKEEEVVQVLKELELLPVINKDSGCIGVTIPSYRKDLEIENDIAEEVIRIIGYDRLPSTLPTLPATVGALNKAQSNRRRISRLLNNSGVNEAITYTLVGNKEISDAVMPLDNHVELACPMSEERKYVRTSILPSLLGSVAYNQARNNKDVALYEISNVYEQNKCEERIAMVISGSLQKNRWQKIDLEADFYMMKGFVENILLELGFSGSRVIIKENTEDTNMFHPYKSACVYLGKTLVGIFGNIHPAMAKRYSLSDCVIMELNMQVLLDNKASKVKFTALNKFPGVTRDLALVVADEIKAEQLAKCIKGSSKLIKAVEVFDVYTGEHVETGYKSIALSIKIESSEATLKDNDINMIVDKVMEDLQKQVNAQLRA
ncbi:MAG: phenylalanine--tRNA ligase subunit beta [Erysipelotrichaceae bacterium]